MKSFSFDQGPPEGDRNLVELREAILTDVSQEGSATNIAKLADELQERLARVVTPASSETRRPQK